MMDDNRDASEIERPNSDNADAQTIEPRENPVDASRDCAAPAVPAVTLPSVIEILEARGSRSATNAAALLACYAVVFTVLCAAFLLASQLSDSLFQSGTIRALMTEWRPPHVTSGAQGGSDEGEGADEDNVAPAPNGLAARRAVHQPDSRIPAEFLQYGREEPPEKLAMDVIEKYSREYSLPIGIIGYEKTALYTVRIGIVGILSLLAGLVVSFYRYHVRMAAFYRSRADILRLVPPQLEDESFITRFLDPLTIDISVGKQKLDDKPLSIGRRQGKVQPGSGFGKVDGYIVTLFVLLIVFILSLVGATSIAFF